MNSKLISSNEEILKQSIKYLPILERLSERKTDLQKHGLYQYQNALTAICMLVEAGIFDNQISLQNIFDGLQAFYWPGRFQLIESQRLIIDAAHNAAGAKALRDSLDYLFPGQRFHFIFACYEDKDGLSMLSNLLKSRDFLYLADPPRGKRSYFSLSELTKHATLLGTKVSAYDTVSESLTQAIRDRTDDEYIVVCGSFSLLKTIMQILGWATVDDK